MSNTINNSSNDTAKDVNGVKTIYVDKSSELGQMMQSMNEREENGIIADAKKN